MSEHKQSEKSGGSEEILERLGDVRRSLLKGLRAVGGEGNTTEIKQAIETESGSEVPVGSTQYHFRWLESEGLIVEVDREEVNHGGRNVIVWGLTDAGEQLLEQIDGQEGREDRPQTLEGLNDRLDELERENEILETRLERFSAFINKFAHIVDLHERELGVVDEDDSAIAEYEEEQKRHEEEIERLKQQG